MFSKKVEEGNVAYKFDIHTAFNTMSCKFLLLVLTPFDFHPSFVDWISTILLSTMFFIRINDSLVDFFPCSRGVRQGDPLTLYFLVLQRKFLVEVSLSL